METNDNKKKKVEIKSIHKGHRERVRNKFLKYGLESFTEIEALEFLLFYAIPYKNTNELAHALIDEFGSLENVLRADIHRLTSVKGISSNSAALIALFNEIYKHIHVNINFEGIFLNTAHRMGRFCCNYFMNHVNETLILISTDSNRKLKSVDVISEGTVSQTPVFYSKVIDMALKNKTSTVFIAHNHPGNNPNPSHNDIEDTKELANYLEKSGIELIDHIVCSGQEFVSMSDKGQI